MGKLDLPQLAGHRECPCKPSYRDPDLPSPAIAPSVRTTLAQLPAHLPGRQRIAPDRMVEPMAPGLPDVHDPDPPAVPQLALARNPPRGPEPMVAGRSVHLGLGSVPRCGSIAHARSSHPSGPPNTLREIPAYPTLGPLAGRVPPMHPLDDRNEQLAGLADLPVLLDAGPGLSDAPDHVPTLRSPIPVWPKLPVSISLHQSVLGLA